MDKGDIPPRGGTIFVLFCPSPNQKGEDLLRLWGFSDFPPGAGGALLKRFISFTDIPTPIQTFRLGDFWALFSRVRCREFVPPKESVLRGILLLWVVDQGMKINTLSLKSHSLGFETYSFLLSRHEVFSSFQSPTLGDRRSDHVLKHWGSFPFKINQFKTYYLRTSVFI